ncbi:hypothetical protein [Undibacterium fentianense]|uniref:Uncharacterized protein n=1 Tax=Undibacterium fentianense TaxID=2828728 RepID=A0A941E1Q3_9BURK|nr:hypothetical protein [Undibacterium fentianense]MBR7799452.1 hypothetical protein [Undibacterium fentianense]
MNYLLSFFRRFFLYLCLLACIAVVTKMSDLFSVPTETGFSILFRAGGVFLVCVVLIALQFLPFSYVFPILLGGFAWAFFPALEYWSSQNAVKSLFGITISDAQWYGRWYAKVAFVLIPIMAGHLLCRRWKQQTKDPRRPVEWAK